MQQRFDVLITGGRLIDGTGNPWRYASVGIVGDRIAAILPPGLTAPENASTVVDATGMVVCPGFIDMLSHSIVPMMSDGRSLSKITQGVTTEIMGESWTPGPIGGHMDDPFAGSPTGRRAIERLGSWQERAASWTHFTDWLEALAEQGVSPNIASFVGGATLRRYGCGMEMGQPDAEAMAAMQVAMRQSMEDGALGVAYALIYPPETYTSSEELMKICSVVGEYGGVYATHLRSESAGLLDAIEEAIQIGTTARVPVEVYHLKASGETNWPLMRAAIERIQRARAEGVDITADIYPYTASGTGLDSVIPAWAAAGGRLFENLSDPATRQRIRDEILQAGGNADGLGARSDPSRIMPVGCEQSENLGYRGRLLSDIAAERGQHWIDAAMDLLVSERQRISTLYFLMDEDNVRMALRQPWVTIGSDSGGLNPETAEPDGPTHPRTYGTFARILGHYVRDEGVLSLEEAIRRMSSAPARRLNLQGRGLIEPGAFADVVVFDPAIVADKATWEHSHVLSTGVRDVWVNGARVLAGGQHTGATPGRVLYGSGKRNA